MDRAAGEALGSGGRASQLPWGRPRGEGGVGSPHLPRAGGRAWAVAAAPYFHPERAAITVLVDPKKTLLPWTAWD